MALVAPGITSSRIGKKLPTNGTRFSSQSQPDQPISCKRCALIMMLAMRNARQRMKARMPPTIRPAVESVLTSARPASANAATIAIVTRLNTIDQARKRRRPIRPSTPNGLSVANSPTLSPTLARGGA
ncbi:hypothetical protein D3C76_1328160 [compost metagenome]